VRTITVSGDRKAVRFTAVEKALVLLSDHLLITDDGNKR
jgi:nicotinamide-nucleotide amidase